MFDKSPFSLSGRIDQLRFRAPSGYTVLQLQPKNPESPKVMVVGYCQEGLESGQIIELTGYWQEHPRHGKQFFAEHYTLAAQVVPLEKFLVHYIKGVGLATAKKLITTFGEDLFEVLNQSPEQIKVLAGIKGRVYATIIASWQSQKSFLEILLFLTEHGLPYFQANKIVKRFGKDSRTIIENNPYCLFEEIDGIGFQTADKLAIKLGFNQEDPRRILGGFLFLLKSAIRDGHCGIFETDLFTQANTLLALPIDPMQAVLQDAAKNKKLVCDTLNQVPCVFLVSLWEQEQAIAKKLKKMCNRPVGNVKLLLKNLIDVIDSEKLPLTQEQQAAIYQAIQSPVFVLTGGPGVGKTTLIKILVRLFKKQNISFALAAPTGRAAKRISESTGHTAKTLHRLLEYDPYAMTFRYDGENYLPVKALVIDESSMIDVPLCATVLAALSPDTRLIFVGDVDQLSAVGPGEVLGGLIGSGKIPFFSLKEIFRQAASSQIIVNAHRVNQGLMPVVDKHASRDFFLIRAGDIDAQQQKILHIATEQLSDRFGFNPLEEIQVITPMNGGPLGVDNLNRLLQEKLNSAHPDKREWRQGDSVFREGDKVLQIINNYEKNVFNGDLGVIHNIDPSRQKMRVFFDKQPIEYALKECEQLKLAYAMTVHKSQGSEYPAVIVVLSLSQRILLKRNLLYTAMTRGKKCVVVVSDLAPLKFAIEQGERVKRISKLEELLREF